MRATGIDRIIKEASVNKVTFYRYFQAKDDLIRAFLDYSHQRWMAWFSRTLEEQVGTGKRLAEALAVTLQRWFETTRFAAARLSTRR